MSAAAVIRAWTDPGSHPRFHEAAKRRLIAEWPSLAKAIEALCAEQNTPTETDAQ